MRNLQSHLGSIVLGVLLVFCLLLLAEQTFAAPLEDTPDDGTVEIVYPSERLAPYRERRGNWGAVFGIQVDQIFPDKYRSRIDDVNYETLFGSSPINLIQGQVGAKYNFSLGSVGANLLLGAGEVQDGRIGNEYGTDDDANLQLTKIGASANFIMDALFDEPYIAPYIEGQIFKMAWLESSQNTDSIAGTTEISSAFTVGVLIQLNWLDPASAFTAQETSGLQNTYLDVFVSQYNSSGADTDPNFETATNYGGGLRFEF